MNPELEEHSNEDKGKGEVQTSVFGFIGRYAVTHTVTYFIAGMIFAAVMNYRELFATTTYSYMRPFDHPLVILGPLLQVFRGAFLALAFLPFRKVIMENKRGWIYLFVALWILAEVGANAADPGKIEGFIYADYPVAHWFATYPESIFQTLTFAWLFHTWERNPKDKRLSIPLIAALVIIAVLLILGVLFTPPV
ncbi:MAG: hypothetical protein WBH57_11915 [Anaerolineae bacterium]